MNIDDIKNIDDFQVYCCTNNEQRYIYSDMVENATPIADCGVPPVVHCRKTGLSAVALSAMEGKLVLRHGTL